jgi:hypothetical protein
MAMYTSFHHDLGKTVRVAIHRMDGPTNILYLTFEQGDSILNVFCNSDEDLLRIRDAIDDYLQSRDAEVAAQQGFTGNIEAPHE